LIYNLLDTFKKAYHIKGDDLVIENHRLKEGLYIKVCEDGTMKSTIIKKDSTVDSNYEWFRKADFYSNLINTNKYIGDKKIHSNNYLTFFIKEKNFKKEKFPKDVSERINKYYKTLEEDKKNNLLMKFINKNEKELDSSYIKKIIVDEMDKEKLKHSKQFILENSDLIFGEIRQFKESDFVKKKSTKKEKEELYIKIYFDYNDWSIYELESKRYLYPRIFNKSEVKTFRTLDKRLYGISNLNVALDDKKSYLKHKNRKDIYPNYIEFNDAVSLYKYSVWLLSNKLGRNFKPFDYDYRIPLKEIKNSNTDSILINMKNNQGNIEFVDFEIIPGFEDNVNFQIHNYVQGSFYNKEIKGYIEPNYRNYNNKNRQDVLKAINDHLYNNKLKQSFNSDLKDIKPPRWGSKKFCNIILLTKESVYNYIYKDDGNGIKNSIDKLYINLVIDGIKRGKEQGVNSFNTYMALKILFDLRGDELVKKIKEMRNNIEKTILDKETHDLEDIYEYSYLAGQISYYLMNQSKSKNKNHDVVERICNYKNVSKINDELKFWFKRYGHAIRMNYSKFNKALSMTLAFNKEKEIDEDIFLAGYLGDNIFYNREER
jgi:CRISPR-associated protein Csh1